jgi:hypothetical protein
MEMDEGGATASALVTSGETVREGDVALFDDIATVLDDVAILSKVAAKKTAGVLGDDLALNAQQVADLNKASSTGSGKGLPIGLMAAAGVVARGAGLAPSSLDHEPAEQVCPLGALECVEIHGGREEGRIALLRPAHHGLREAPMAKGHQVVGQSCHRFPGRGLVRSPGG